MRIHYEGKVKQHLKKLQNEEISFGKFVELLNEDAGLQFSQPIVSGELPTDTEMLNWIEAMMIPKDNYCEIFFAGLRNGNSDADEFQIESNPEKFKVLNAKNIREVIAKAMKEVGNFR